MDSGPGDEMLLLAVAERDIGAFRTLYERHAGWLAIRLARRCIVSPNAHWCFADLLAVSERSWKAPHELASATMPGTLSWR